MINQYLLITKLFMNNHIQITNMFMNNQIKMGKLFMNDQIQIIGITNLFMKKQMDTQIVERTRITTLL